MNHQQEIVRYHTAMSSLGFSYDDAEQIRRDAQRLHRWAENECNGDIERDEETGKTYRTYNHNGPGPIRRYPTADKETPAIKRLKSIAKEHGMVAMIQGDPRGWPVQICKPEDVKDESNYNGVGVPIRS